MSKMSLKASLVAAAVVCSAPIVATAADLYMDQNGPAYAQNYRGTTTSYVDARSLQCRELVIEYRYTHHTEIVTNCYPPVFGEFLR